MRKIKNNLLLNKFTYLFLFIFVVVGFFFRIKGLSSNYSFWGDEASSAPFARAILEKGKPLLSSGYAANEYVFHFYVMAFSLQWFGINEFAARLPSVVLGTL